jgi:hypothetical protein
MSCESGQGVTNLDEHIVEWICMALPANPKQLTLGSFNADSFQPQQRRENFMWQLSDSPTQAIEEQPFIFDLY